MSHDPRGSTSMEELEIELEIEAMAAVCHTRVSV